MPTVITATVVDSDSIAWANGSWVLSFTPAPGYPDVGIYNVNGVPLNPAVTSQSGVMDASGIFSLTCYTTSEVTPSGSSWVLSLSPNASVPASQYNFKTTGSSMNLSASLTAAINAPRFQAKGSGAYGYADVEALVQIVYGGAYWNVITKSVRVWDGTKFLDLVTGGSAATSNLFGPVKIASNIPATISSNQPSPTFQLSGNYWNGSASVIDSWTMTDSLGAGVNPTSTLAFTHGGTPGAVTASFPAPVLISGAANNLLISGSIAGSQTSISATGTDTNVGISLIPKGSGKTIITSALSVATSNAPAISLDFTGASLGFGVAANNAMVYFYPNVGGRRTIGFSGQGTGSGLVLPTSYALSFNSDAPGLADPPTASDVFVGRYAPSWISIQGQTAGQNPGNLALTHNSSASAGANWPGGVLRIQGSYWNGAAGAADLWQLVHSLSTPGTNPTSTFTLSHSGSPGTTLFSIATPTKITDATAAANGVGALVVTGGVSATGGLWVGGGALSGQGQFATFVYPSTNSVSSTAILIDLRNSAATGGVAVGLGLNGAQFAPTGVVAINSLSVSARVDGGTATASQAACIVATAQATGGATITQAVDFYAKTITAASSTITNAYGMYIEPQTAGATNNYAIFTTGSAFCSFGGNVGIGTTQPKAPLHVMNLPIYTTNALAIAGGLTAGAFYRNGADPDVVMVVH